MASSAVNLLDLAAASLSSVIVAADLIREMSTTDENDTGVLPSHNNVRLKADGSVVTDADFAAQSIIVQSLQYVSNDIRIVGEESEEEMAKKSMTGMEDKIQAMFHLAQKEIQMRYNSDGEGSSDLPFPLAQQRLAQNDDATNAETEASPSTSQDRALEKLKDCEVDPSRVSVFIDPLDGTKCYAEGEFDAVSILVGIVLDGMPCFGVICKPFGYAGHTTVMNTECVVFYGGTLLGAAYTAGGSTLRYSLEGKLPEDLPRAVISGSKAKGIIKEFVAHLGNKGIVQSEPLLVSGAGEKSLRMIIRSHKEGLWFYPKAGTSLWDVAASDAILRILGGKLTDKNGKNMDYSRSQAEALNRNGVVACYDATLHAECIRLFTEGSWEATE
ncbi:unnamed protein product [Cylindrotheca closterium]|uniref:3'(2'),5'-bisphosphate nucleotidase 1 n=1 Tax=Cylindrotheca closterium TaxID=2856 RepID=A0AAD2CC04_9STRA|nr:unnamed protein product [Cylindrotheca closterium]